MGLIIDRTEWVDSVYLIELTDPVQGGENGINNIQAKQLANRTRYLKALFDLEHTDTGNHSISNSGVTDDAGITENKLNLAYHTNEIKDVITNVRTRNSEVEYRLDDLVGIKGSMVSALGKAIPLSWRNSERGFEFDMFAAVFTYQDEAPITLTRTIKGDDSVDVDSTGSLVVGNNYVVSSGDGLNSEVVRVKQILTTERFLATEKLKFTRSSGSVSQSSWSLGTGKAEASNGSVIISKTINILQNHASGKFVVRLKSNGAVVVPFYQVPGETTWTRGMFLETTQRVAGYSDMMYVVAGGPIILKLEVTAPAGVLAEVDHMCVLPFEQGGAAEAVKQPIILSPTSLQANVLLTGPVEWTEYRSLYGIAQKAVEVQIATDGSFTDVVWSFAGTNETSVPITLDSLVTDTTYHVRVRQQDTEDVWSRWSDDIVFSTGDILGVVSKPTGVFPSSGLTDIATDVTLTGSIFISEPADTHVKSQWQIALDAGFITIVHDSGEVASLTSYRVADGILTEDTTYYWRVRYKGEALGWSEYSTATLFVTYAVQIENLFSTTLYTGNGTTQTINNGIDLAGEGGLVWGKRRDQASAHVLFDTIRGIQSALTTNSAGANYSVSGVTNFNSNGFTVGSEYQLNASGGTYASWTFRKAPKFFDIVQYTGNGVAGRQIAHNLGVEPGMIIVKATLAAYDWAVYHRGHTSAEYYTRLNETYYQVPNNTIWNSTPPTDTVFSVGAGNSVNGAGGTYIAYLFAHDDSADGVVQCGSFMNMMPGQAVNLGWEPQYVLVKGTDGSDNWTVIDTARGFSENDDRYLFPNTSQAESGGVGASSLTPTPEGFKFDVTYSGTYIYLAIRAPEA